MKPYDTPDDETQRGKLDHFTNNGGMVVDLGIDHKTCRNIAFDTVGILAPRLADRGDAEEELKRLKRQLEES